MRNKKDLFLGAILGILVFSGLCAGVFFIRSIVPAQVAYSTYESAPIERKDAMARGAYSKSEAMAMEAVTEEGSYDTGSNELTSAEPIQPIDINRKLIRTMGLSVETTAFDDMLKNLQQLVSVTGGYIENSNVSGNSVLRDSDRRYANLTVRVPTDRLDSFVSQVNDQGNVTNQWERVEDVTLQYTDVESRKKSLQLEQERIWSLLEKADSMDSIVVLEKRLSEIRYELESYESKLRTYDNQIEYSTVTIDISEVKVFTPTEPDSFGTRIRKGFERNLKDLIETLTALAVWFISSLPTLLLLAILITALFFGGRKFFHRRNKKPDIKPASEETRES